VDGGLNASRDTGRVKRHDPDGQQNAIPAERRPEHAGAASKGGEHRHELTIL
jgi:hypothetical protein